MCRHLIAFAALSRASRSHQRLPAGVIVLAPHGDDGADTGKAVDHNADERAIAKGDEG